MADLKTKTISGGVGDILAIDGGIHGSTARQIKDGDGNASPFYITQTKVGIGTADPESKLTVKGDPANADQPVRITNSVIDSHTALFINGTGTAINEKYGLQFGGYDEYSIGGIFGVMDSNSGSTSGDITIDFANGTSGGALIEKVRFTHEGNVGIGTTDPSERLDIGQGNMRFGGASSGGFTLDNYSGSPDAGYLRFGDGSGWKFHFGRWSETILGSKNTGTTGTVMTINSGSGNVGIGNPAPGSNLEVSSVGAESVLEISAFSATDPAHNPHLIFFKSGSSGINGLNSTANGEVLGLIDFKGVDAGNVQQSSVWIRAEQIGSDGDSVKGVLRFYTSDGDDAGTPTERLTILDAGNVGIGTASPDAKLEVEGSVNDGTRQINVKGTAISGATSGGVINLICDDNVAMADTHRMGMIQWSGAEASGGSAIITAGSIAVHADETWSSSQNGAYMAFGLNYGNNAGVTERMRIDDAGNVGIGTPIPNYPLHVVGAGLDSYVAKFDNSGTASATHGLKISCGDTVHGDDATHYIRFEESDGGLVGEIDTLSGNLHFNDTSDYRLKENINLISGGLAKVNSLKPSYFNYKKYPNKIHQGFIAHEVQDAGIDYAVTGDKDAMETKVTPAVEAVVAVEAVSAKDAVYETVTKQRQKVVVTEVEEEQTSTEIVEEGGKYIQKTTTKTVTKEVSTPQYEEVKLFDEDGKEIGTHQIPVTEDYEEEALVSESIEAIEAVEAVEAVAEKTEQVDANQLLAIANLIPQMVSAIQELSAKVDALENA